MEAKLESKENIINDDCVLESIINNPNDSLANSNPFLVSHYDYYKNQMSNKPNTLKIIYLHASKDLFRMNSDRHHRDLLENQCNYGIKSMRTRFVVVI